MAANGLMTFPYRSCREECDSGTVSSAQHPKGLETRGKCQWPDGVRSQTHIASGLIPAPCAQCPNGVTPVSRREKTLSADCNVVTLVH